MLVSILAVVFVLRISKNSDRHARKRFCTRTKRTKADESVNCVFPFLGTNNSMVEHMLLLALKRDRTHVIVNSINIFFLDFLSFFRDQPNFASVIYQLVLS